MGRADRSEANPDNYYPWLYKTRLITVPAYEHCCKVGRVADKYDLSPGVADADVNDELRARWLGLEEYPETGLRPLVDWFHQLILKTVYVEHGRSTIEHRLKSEYEALAGDDEQDKQGVLADLAAEGIDGDELLSDFISAPTLYRHLTGCCGITKEIKESDTDWEASKLEYTEERAQEYTRDVLKSWENKEEVSYATEAEISINIYLKCPVCSRQTAVRRARRQGYICKEHMSETSGPPDQYL